MLVPHHSSLILLIVLLGCSAKRSFLFVTCIWLCNHLGTVSRLCLCLCFYRAFTLSIQSLKSYHLAALNAVARCRQGQLVASRVILRFTSSSLECRGKVPTGSVGWDVKLPVQYSRLGNAPRGRGLSATAALGTLPRSRLDRYRRPGYAPWVEARPTRPPMVRSLGRGPTASGHSLGARARTRL